MDEVEFPDCKLKIILLSEGRLVKHAAMRQATVDCHVGELHEPQMLAQIELFTKQGQYGRQVYTLPKRLDEKVAKLHLEKIGVKLTEMTVAQSDYLSVPVEGPFKPEHYRY